MEQTLPVRAQMAAMPVPLAAAATAAVQAETAAPERETVGAVPDATTVQQLEMQPPEPEPEPQLLREMSELRAQIAGDAHPFDTVCLPLSYSGNPEVNVTDNPGGEWRI
jgi:hypothetical protein